MNLSKIINIFLFFYFFSFSRNFALKLKRNLDVIGKSLSLSIFCLYWDKSCNYSDKQSVRDDSTANFPSSLPMCDPPEFESTLVTKSGTEALLLRRTTPTNIYSDFIIVSLTPFYLLVDRGAGELYVG
jgi:hypothetical protein